MPKLNENYLNVQDSYLFAEIARRVKVYEENHPDKAEISFDLELGTLHVHSQRARLKRFTKR